MAMDLTGQPPANSGGSDNVTNQFSMIRNMLGTAGKNPGSAGQTTPVATENLEGNSLDKITRSLTNFLGTSGVNTMGTGNDILGAGGSITSTGLDLLSMPISYFTALASGDPKAIAQATGGYSAAVGKQFDAAERSSSQDQVRGGFRSSTLANLPFQKAAQIGNYQQGLQSDAAGKLAAIASGVSSVGLSQQGVGVNEQQVGIQEILGNLQNLLTRRGQNNQEAAGIMSMIGQLGQGIGSIIGGKLAG